MNTKNRARFVQANRACIECLYAQACRAKLRDPVVVVLDLRDDDAAKLARSCVEDRRKVRDLIADCQRDDSIPSAIVVFAYEQAQKKMGTKFSHLRGELSRRAPPASFHAIVVAFGENVHWTHVQPSLAPSCAVQPA